MMASKNIDEGHMRCRKMVCIVCYGKGRRNISEKELTWIRENLIDGFNIDNPSFPAAICDHCHILLSRRIAGNDERSLPIVDNYDPGQRVFTRNSTKCDCKICKTAKSSINSTKPKKRGRPKTNPDEMAEEIASFKVCGRCFSRIGKGLPHNCSSKREKVSNVQTLLHNTPKTAQRVASRIINETGTPFLETLGNKPKQVGPDPKMAKKQLFTASDMSVIQKDLNLSTRQVITLAEDMRCSSGIRHIIEKDMRGKIREMNRQLENLFEKRECTFAFVNETQKVHENFQQNVIVCTDITLLIEKVIEERDITDPLIRIGLDGGRGFMKVCLSIFNLDEKAKEFWSTKRLGERFQDSGVKKVLILGIVPDIQENYVNIKRLWLETGIDRIARKFTIATDLKLCNILLGLQSHSSTHPCCWCNITKGNLENKGTPRTIANLMDLFWAYFDARAKKQDAKDYGNVIHPNVFVTGDIDENTLIILLVPPPELHLLIGPVNVLYDELSKVWPQCKQWIEQLHVKREDYHGGSFNGNDSRKLLKNIAMLEQIAPENVSGFVETFKAFNKVVDSCYGKELLPDYKVQIFEFKQCYKKLKIGVTPKVHAVFHHIAEFCDVVQMGLSPWSEQTAESLHSDFSKVWNNFKVRNTDHPEYGQRLLKAIVTYNSQHL